MPGPAAPNGARVVARKRRCRLPPDKIWRALTQCPLMGIG
jgi:hypothetical protein